MLVMKLIAVIISAVLATYSVTVAQGNPSDAALRPVTRLPVLQIPAHSLAER